MDIEMNVMRWFRPTKRRTLMPALLLALTCQVGAADIWVAPMGLDEAPGTQDQPKATLAAALRQARELRRLNDPSIAQGVTIHLKGGTYWLDEPVLFRPEDNGTPTSPTVVQAVPGDVPVLSGGTPVTGWQRLTTLVPGIKPALQGDIWFTDHLKTSGHFQAPQALAAVRQLWVNGSKRNLAASTDADSMMRILFIDKENKIIRIPNTHPTSFVRPDQVLFFCHKMWETALLRVQTIKEETDALALTFHEPESRIQFEHPWPQTVVSPKGNSAFRLLDAPEFLDTPGEWWLDRITGRLYYYPLPGEDMNTAEVVVPCLETLVWSAGTKDHLVKHLLFKGICFAHSAWSRPALNGYVPLQAGMYLLDAYKLAQPGTPDKAALENQAWLGRPAASVRLDHTHDTRFERCRFEHIGATALDLSQGCRNDQIEGCRFNDVAGNGLVMGHFSATGSETHVPYKPVDRREVTGDILVHNNLFTDIANEYWGCVGILAGYVDHVNITHNELKELSYSGISLGWGWTHSPTVLKGNRIQGNLVHRYGKYNYSCGGLYTLSAQEGTVIKENSVHSIYQSPYAHDPSAGFAIYLDEASSGMTVIDNWTDTAHFGFNQNGPLTFTNNGPQVSERIRKAAGLVKPEVKEATWIWYPGDFDIWLGNNMQNRRTERGTFFPPFWKMDSHYPLVEFSTRVDLEAPETIELAVEGRYNVKIDGRFLPGSPERVCLSAGPHTIHIKVFNQSCVPALYVNGPTVRSGSHWNVTFEDKEWIDNSGKASDNSGTTYVKAGSWRFNSPSDKPSQFKLATEPQALVASRYVNNGLLIDFGRETMGYPRFHELVGSGELKVFYGESMEEALDTAHCETLDILPIQRTEPGELVFDQSRAYRYLYVLTTGNVRFSKLDMLYEFSPVTYKGAFRCSDDLLNDIWKVGAYTMHLTTRELFIDGIKRDRWAWSGDATQSYLMNYYLFFDNPTVQRTMQYLRGKDPVTSHLNTIMDYTMYWFISLYDYYLYTGDKAFIEQMYPRMERLMDFVLGRRNERGLLEGQAGDWVFIDWADGYLEKKGEVSFEQLLFCRCLETMALCSGLIDKPAAQARYQELAEGVKQQLLTDFWSEEKQAFLHARVNGQPEPAVTRYTNMFAILFHYLNKQQQEGVKNKVILNDSILKISTPYMRFYELEAMCAMGETDYVLKEIRSYWGGMLREGATSFWEKYNPEDTGVKHLTMYNRPYGKSLCHAWGASPVYLLGKYYLGVKPVQPGYATFEVRPVLGDLQWMEGKVPTPDGVIEVYADVKTVRVTAPAGEGYLYFDGNKPTVNRGQLEQLPDGTYRVKVPGDGRPVVVTRQGLSKVKPQERVVHLYHQASSTPRVRYGVERLKAALEKTGVRVHCQALTPTEARRLSNAGPTCLYVGQEGDPLLATGFKRMGVKASGTLKKEGFDLLGRNGVYVLRGHDATGTLYACLALADSLAAKGTLPAALHVTDYPEMVLRGTCVGLQKPVYLPGRNVYEYPYTQETFPWFYDKELWIKYLDMLVENRMNSLYLWNGHPFASLVRLHDYPYALEVSEEDFRRNEELFSFLTQEADKRGIWVIQMFYNILLSKPFAEYHGLKTQDRSRPITPLIADYTRKSITAFIQKYPNVGLLVCLGEAMDTYEDDVNWFTKTILPGVRDGLDSLGIQEEVPIILRAHDTDCELVMKAALPLYKHLYTMNKYNGESLVTYEPGGPWGETHRALSRLGSTHIANVHILANLEPFRWTSPDFIQRCVRAMHDVHGANALHLYPQASYWDWPYTADKVDGRLLQLDRDQLWYKAWARYAWKADRDRTDEKTFWTRQLDALFGCGDQAGSMLEAMEAMGTLSPMLARKFAITEGNRQTFLLGSFMSQLVNPDRWRVYPDFPASCDPGGERLADYVRKAYAGQSHLPNNPLQVIREARIQADEAVAAIHRVTGVTRNKAEFERWKLDILAMQAFTHALADKVEAAVRVMRYDLSGDLADLDAAAPFLKRSVEHYRRLVDNTRDRYLYANSMQTKQRRVPIGGDDGRYTTWAELLPLFEQEYAQFELNRQRLHRQARGEAEPVVIKPWKPVEVTLLHPKQDLEPLALNTHLFTDRESPLTAVAEELKDLKGLRFAFDAQANHPTDVHFRCDKPVSVVVGYFSSVHTNYLFPPRLETDASANDHGQAEVRLAHALTIKGQPSVNVHTYTYPAGEHHLRLPKGVVLVLGFVDGSQPTPARDAGLGEKTNIDWLFD